VVAAIISQRAGDARTYDEPQMSQITQMSPAPGHGVAGLLGRRRPRAWASKSMWAHTRGLLLPNNARLCRARRALPTRVASSRNLWNLWHLWPRPSFIVSTRANGRWSWNEKRAGVREDAGPW